jgi:hypothetical protein
VLVCVSVVAAVAGWSGPAFAQDLTPLEADEQEGASSDAESAEKTDQSSAKEGADEAGKGGGDQASAASDEESGDKASGDADEAEGDRELPEEAYDPAWARYREAFATLAGGNPEKALEQLRTLADNYEGHPAALFTGPVIEQLEGRLEGDGEEKAADRDGGSTADATDPGSGEELAWSETDRLGVERKTDLARAGLVGFQTLHGLAFGLEFCAMAQCQGVRPGIASTMIGAGLGLGASLYATSDGITPGRAAAVNAGTRWGLWQAAALNSITDNWRNGPNQAVPPLVAGQLLGTAGGAVAAHAWRPNAGDVTMANWVGIWSGVGTGLLTVTAGIQPTTRQLMTAILATTNVGAVAGGFWAFQQPISRGRVWVVNTGGLLGGLVGAGVPLLLAGDSLESAQPIGALTLLGTASGLGVATVLTEEWDVRDGSGDGRRVETSMSVRPTVDGEGAMLTIGGEF